MKSMFIVLLVATSAAAQSAPRDVDITSADGTRLKGTYFAAGPGRSARGEGGPAVLLLHMCNTTRQSWEPVARQLASVGIAALTVDNRGFGESGGPRYTGATPDVQREVSQQWPADFDAALAWLEAQPAVSKSRMGVGGGSCGVNNAVQLASRHPEIHSLVLLAGGTDYAGVQSLSQHPWLPVFTAAAADDQYDSHAPDLMRWFAEFTGNPRSRFVGFKDGRHGTEMFAPHPELPRQIVEWWDETLTKSPVEPGAPFTRKKTPASDFWAVLNQKSSGARAAEQFRQTRQRDRSVFLFPEFIVNQLAYTRLQNGDKDDAIELFRLNVEAFPTSANAYDSLADGYIARGQNDLALAAQEKCLQLLPADTLNEEFRTLLRRGAEQKIAKLKGKR
jgi:dienelactone hydrolase